LLRSEIRCEERGKITVKGLAYPVTTYQVIDAVEQADRANDLIREEHAHFRLDLDLGAMSRDERERAAETLRQALDRISPVHPERPPEDPRRTASD
jgi:hypothetical protein